MRLDELAKAIEAEVPPGRLSAIEIDAAATLEDALAGQVTFLANAKYQSRLKDTRASAVIVGSGVTDEAVAPEVALLRTRDPYYAFMRAVVVLHGHRRHPHAGVDPRAMVDPTAKIGQGSVVYPGAYVGPGATIGRDCVLYPNCVVYEKCVLGDRVIVHAGASIGNDGFGYATHQGAHHKIPQVGNTVLEDDVEVGAGSVIARAAMGSTVIAKGTKIDSLSMVGHGARVGEHGLLVAQSGVAGSATIGHHVALGGQVGVAGHLKIGNNVSVAAQSGVIGDLPDGAIVGGTPEVPLRTAKRIAALWKRLPELFSRVKNLEERAGIKADDGGDSE